MCIYYFCIKILSRDVCGLILLYLQEHSGVYVLFSSCFVQYLIKKTNTTFLAPVSLQPANL